MKDLGLRIHLLRTRQHMTLQHVADKCGCAKSMLSKIENGKASPSIAMLTRIAATLGTTVSKLLGDTSATEQRVVLSKSKAILAHERRADAGYAFYPIAAERTEKGMEPYLIVAEEKDITPHKLSHRGEEFIYVLSGAMEMTVGDTTYRLGSGDSIYFDGEEEHHLHPCGKVKYLIIHQYDPKGERG